MKGLVILCSVAEYEPGPHLCLWLLARMFVFKQLCDCGTKGLLNTMIKVSAATTLDKRYRLATVALSMEPSSTAKRSKDFSVREAGEHLLQNL